MVTLHADAEGVDHVYSVAPFNVINRDGDIYTFQLTQSIDNAGTFKVGIRMYPKNVALPHRQDFCYVRWF